MTNPNTKRSDPDQLFVDIAEYTVNHEIESEEAYKTAYYCFIDTLGGGFLALRYPECLKHIGPIVPGTTVPYGARVPGTHYVLDPVQATYSTGCLIRWLDFNDTFLAKGWAHPSDNLGAILSVADYVSRQRKANKETPLTIRDVLTALIKGHEIQGGIAIENDLNRVGLDHVLFLKVSSAAVATAMLGGRVNEIINTVSNAWIDGAALRVYRQYPNTGARKSWAAADATSRGVRLAILSVKGEMGYPTALTAKRWGVHEVLFNGDELVLNRPFDSFVMERTVFKVPYPAEIHSQTAIEGAVRLYPQVKDRLEEIERVELTTHEGAIMVIDKKGPLFNPADRDHCLQYIVAIGLIFGDLTNEHYEEAVARDPRIDLLRDKMVVKEDKRYSKDYLDLNKRSIANAVQVFFKDGSSTEKIEIEYPLGHRRRRDESIPKLMDKFIKNVHARFPEKQAEEIISLCQDPERLEQMPVHEFMDKLVI